MAILGAGGSIGNELAAVLAEKNAPFRLVGRNPRPVGGAEVFAADLSDRQQTIEAVSGSYRGVSSRGAQIRSRGLAGTLAADHGKHNRGLQTSTSEADLLRQRLHVWEGRRPDDRADALRTLQQERRNPRGDRKYAYGTSQRGQSRGDDRSLRGLLRTSYGPMACPTSSSSSRSRKGLRPRGS